MKEYELNRRRLHPGQWVLILHRRRTQIRRKIHRSSSFDYEGSWGCRSWDCYWWCLLSLAWSIKSLGGWLGISHTETEFMHGGLPNDNSSGFLPLLYTPRGGIATSLEI